MMKNKHYFKVNYRQLIQILYVIEALWLVYCIFRTNAIIEFHLNEVRAFLYCGLISVEDAKMMKWIAYGLLFSLPLQLKWLLKQVICKEWFSLLTLKLVIIYVWFSVV